MKFIYSNSVVDIEILLHRKWISTFLRNCGAASVGE